MNMKSKITSSIVNKVLAIYTDKTRYYHDSAHIKFMLNEFSNLLRTKEELYYYFDEERISNFKLAIIFHDSVQNHKDTDIEDSIRLMKEFLQEYKFYDTDYISSLIKATDHSINKALSFDEALIHDLDLLILGQNESVYQVYKENIRKECPNIDDVAFNKGRLEVIKKLLSKPIYITKYFKGYETQARENLTKERDELTQCHNIVEKFFNYLDIDRSYITAEEVLKLMELLHRETEGKVSVSLNQVEFVHDILNIFVEGMETNKFKIITESDISSIFSVDIKYLTK